MIYVAMMDTRNFSFVAAGNSEEDAIAQMKNVWTRHTAQYGRDGRDRFNVPFTKVEDLMDEYGITVLQLEAGTAMRDGSVI